MSDRLSSSWLVVACMVSQVVSKMYVDNSAQDGNEGRSGAEVALRF